MMHAGHGAFPFSTAQDLTSLLAAIAPSFVSTLELITRSSLMPPQDHPNVMSDLIHTCGAHPARADAQGRNALMHAAGCGSLQAVQLLLGLGPQLTPPLELGAADVHGYGALHHACLGGSVEVVEVRRASGAGRGAWGVGLGEPGCSMLVLAWVIDRGVLLLAGPCASAVCSTALHASDFDPPGPKNRAGADQARAGHHT